jgi:hypothetical protein
LLARVILKINDNNKQQQDVSMQIYRETLLLAVVLGVLLEISQFLLAIEKAVSSEINGYFKFKDLKPTSRNTVLHNRWRNTKMKRKIVYLSSV